LTAEIEFEDKLHEFIIEIENFGEFYKSLKEFFPLHINGEVMINDKWIPADLTFNSEIEIALKYHILQLGHDSTGSWEIGHRGDFLYYEGLPLEFWDLYEELLRAFPGAVKNVNDAFSKLTAKGKEILDNIGEREKHERMMKGVKSYDELTEELVDAMDKEFLGSYYETI
jgi:hypothetical protein